MERNLTPPLDFRAISPIHYCPPNQSVLRQVDPKSVKTKVTGPDLDETCREHILTPLSSAGPPENPKL